MRHLRVLISTAALLVFSAQSADACQFATRELVDDFFQKELKKSIKSDERYKNFEIVNIKSVDDRYIVDLKRARTKKSLRFKINLTPDCKAKVEEIPK